MLNGPKRLRVLVISSTVVIILFLLYRALFLNQIKGLSSAYELDKPIRRKIWQTTKLSPMSLEERDRKNLEKWDGMNPTWRHEVLTDGGCDEYVRDRFVERPDIVSLFTGLKDNILRADLIRYLVLLGDGGIYSDIDTESLRPIDEWVPPEYKDATNAVLGVEYDTFGQDPAPALLIVQFVNWTIMSKSRHPLMDLTVRNAIRAIEALAEKQQVSLGQIQATFNDVLASTGPALLTTATFEYLSEATGTNVSWLNVTGITAPKLIHDILILPVTAFGNGQRHSNAGTPEDPAALVHHLFSGSWKTGSHAFKAMAQADTGVKIHQEASMV
ncbi:hypothetical protein MMC17_002542 [Xylographa soralifera]|nr:hypothetical protein [Xylographa soralifera]